MIDIYLAWPYTHKDGGVEKNRLTECAWAAKAIQQAKLTVFAPTLFCKEWAEICNLPTTYEYWSRFDEDYIANCTEIWVPLVSGLEVSQGVYEETLYSYENYHKVHIFKPAAINKSIQIFISRYKPHLRNPKGE